MCDAIARAALRVLLVEDDALVRLSAAGLIEELGHLVHEAADAKSALDHLQGSAEVDVMLTDVGLPDMKGQELAEEARRLRPRLGIIFTTGYAQDSLGVAGDRIAFLGKPYRPEELAEALHKAVGD